MSIERIKAALPDSWGIDWQNPQAREAVIQKRIAEAVEQERNRLVTEFRQALAEGPDDNGEAD